MKFDIHSWEEIGIGEVCEGPISGLVVKASAPVALYVMAENGDTALVGHGASFDVSIGEPFRFWAEGKARVFVEARSRGVARSSGPIFTNTDAMPSGHVSEIKRLFREWALEERARAQRAKAATAALKAAAQPGEVPTDASAASSGEPASDA